MNYERASCEALRLADQETCVWQNEGVFQEDNRGLGFRKSKSLQQAVEVRVEV